MATSQRPSFSILTPVLNGARYVRDCIQSVAAQGYPDLEHIVADGGSRDGTLELLGAFPVRVLAGPDAGLYDGINRALDASRGDIIGILNADDEYPAEVLSAVAEGFSDSALMAVFGGALMFGELDAEGRPIVNEERDPWFMATLGSPIINAWFFRRAVFARLGNFSTRYAVAGDREFLLRFALSGLSFREIPRVCCRYRVHENSLTFTGHEGVWRAVLDEHHAMTGEFLRRSDLTARARRLLKGARSRDALKGALYCAEHGEMGKLWMHTMAGVRHDPVWPMRLAAAAARRLMKTRGVPT
jgi:glycosyltransferase involved in cell wall biosynthesis